MGIFLRLLKGTKLSDQDRVTKLLDTPAMFSKMAIAYSDDKKINKDVILLVARTVYYAVFYRIPNITKEELDTLKELTQVVEYNEDEIVKTLKYRIWNYQDVLREEIHAFMRDSGELMGRLHNL